MMRVRFMSRANAHAYYGRKMITKRKSGVVLVVVLLSTSSLFNLSLAQGMELALCVNGVSIICANCASAILRNPESKTIFLDESAVFTCETDGHFSGWEMNGTVAGDLPPAIFRDLEFSPNDITDHGTTFLKLTIPARAEYNNTRVQCAVVTLSGSSAESETAILKVQGITYVSIYSMNKCLQ